MHLTWQLYVVLVAVLDCRLVGAAEDIVQESNHETRLPDPAGPENHELALSHQKHPFSSKSSAKNKIKSIPPTPLIRNRIPESEINNSFLQKRALIIIANKVCMGGRWGKQQSIHGPFSDYRLISPKELKRSGAWVRVRKRDDGGAPRDTYSPLWVQAEGMAKNIARLTGLAPRSVAKLNRVCLLGWRGVMDASGFK